VLSERGYQNGQRIVLINPNAAVDLAPNVRRWPEERYSELAKKICDGDRDAFVGVIGAPDEQAYASRIAAAAREGRVASLAGALSLRELLALLSFTDLFVTNDSGPMHLACLVDVPIIGLFFADTPILFGPLVKDAVSVSPPLYSLPLYTVYTGKSSEGLENVPARAVAVDDVLSHVRDALGRVDRTRTIPQGLH
jgi:ADP-heptose:LPS heptosyltransferase